MIINILFYTYYDIIIPLYLNIFPVVDDVAINIGLEISPILLGSVVVIAPAIVGERK